MVLYGHTPVPRAEWLNNTLCLDTGCVFGGRLTALNYPERSMVSVPAAPFTMLRRGLSGGPTRLGPAGPGSAAGREPPCSTSPTSPGSRVIETAYLPRIRIAKTTLRPRWR